VLTTSPRHHRLRLLTGLFAVLVVLGDQASKWWAETSLELFEYHPVIGDLLGWRLVYNPGAAFGMAADFTWALTILAGIAVLALTVYGFTNRAPSTAIGIAALLGGAISHLGDRLFRDPGFAVGHIVDFIDYSGFFVGNVADIFLVGGAIYLVIASLVQKDPTSTPDERPAQENS
jgi:signal peptidase II